MSDITPVMQQYLEIKKAHDDAILFFRMGDFYEMFFDDARLAARELGITLTSREKNKKDPVPMAGIPYHAVNGYMSKLLRAGYKVAICEQTSLPGKSKGPVKREVVQVVSPGTAMNEEILESRGNNYIVSLVLETGNTGIAIADLSTGEFRAGEIPGNGAWLDELERIGPAEILLSENESPETETAIKSRLDGVMITYRDGWTFERNYAEDNIRNHLRVAGLKGFGIEDSGLAIAAAGGMLSYLVDTQKASLGHMTTIKRFRPDETMFLDARTRRNLELTSAISDDVTAKGTLFGVIDETLTPMGSRLLKTWITSPLLDPDEINRRLDGVAELADDSSARSEIGGILSTVHDVERLIGRVCLERANPRDLLSLAESLECSERFREALDRFGAGILKSKTYDLTDLREVAALITNSLVDEPPMLLTDGGIFRDGYNAELDDLRNITHSGRKWIAELQEKERRRTGISNMKIRYNNVFGYFIEVSKGNLDRVPEDYHRKQTLVNAERFITPELKEYESKVLSAGERISELERELFVELRKTVALRVKEIQAFSQAVAVVDVLHAFAEVAAERKYVRPVVDTSTVIEITEGRHPVVETILPAGKFVSNDTLIDTGKDQILIITGPNMAGKSTYLRQVGLIVLMAQAGSFVPAESAHIGVVDRIFTRVGASDNLAGGESTFLVEMNETANILNNCTPRSLILFDEVGRGTSTFDGLSIAWAIVEYLHQVKRSAARTLFATHFHELTEIALILERVKNYNISVTEWNDEVIFLRKIVEGGSDQSLGIQVARLAGLPSQVIARAKEILANLEANEFTVNNEPKIAAAPPEQKGAYQLSLFELPEHPVVQELRDLDIDNLTPMRALLLLEQLKRKVTLKERK
ncbi:DNA mismatch repair protein MutS [bacterium]|nr:DNA mismatch repair protein MutS [bacterium]